MPVSLIPRYLFIQDEYTSIASNSTLSCCRCAIWPTQGGHACHCVGVQRQQFYFRKDSVDRVIDQSYECPPAEPSQCLSVLKLTSNFMLLMTKDMERSRSCSPRVSIFQHLWFDATLAQASGKLACNSNVDLPLTTVVGCRMKYEWPWSRAHGKAALCSQQPKAFAFLITGFFWFFSFGLLFFWVRPTTLNSFSSSIFAYTIISIITEVSVYEKGGLCGNTLDNHSRLGTSCLRHFRCLPMSFVAHVAGRHNLVRHRDTSGSLAQIGCRGSAHAKYLVRKALHKSLA